MCFKAVGVIFIVANNFFELQNTLLECLNKIGMTRLQLVLIATINNYVGKFLLNPPRFGHDVTRWLMTIYANKKLLQNKNSYRSSKNFQRFPEKKIWEKNSEKCISKECQGISFVKTLNNNYFWRNYSYFQKRLLSKAIQNQKIIYRCFY